jgi:tripartite motif-containing protein 71
MRCFLVLAIILGMIVPIGARAQAPSLLSTWTTGGAHGLGRPWHIDFDAIGNVYVTDPAAERVFSFTSDGNSITSWTCPALPPIGYFFPQGLAVSADGHVYVTTPSTNGPAQFRLASFTTTGAYLGTLGTMGTDPGQLGAVFDVAADAGGNLFLADASNARVEVLTSSGGFVTEWGGYGSGPGQFRVPLAIAVSPAGLVYVTDDDNQRVQVFTSSGAFVRQWGSYGSGPGQFAGPWGIALDAAGNVYVADASNNRIQVFTATGEFLTEWGGIGSGPGQFFKPMGVGVGPNGLIYVADSWNSRIQVFGPAPTPIRSTTWGRLKAAYR